ncbi:MAG: transporter substrate-binding domain-containing protein [Synergistaceae bacterium]|nr:transporter substrate-binding domain-containing protein [Synergistaceae bacterium]
MKKFFAALLLIALFAGSSFAAGHRVGMLAKLCMNASDFASSVRYQYYSLENLSRPEFEYFDSINAMQLALQVRKIDEIALPEVVAEYLMTADPNYLINCTVIMKDNPMAFAFGFKSDNQALRDEFNKALAELKRDGTLITLQAQYITPRDSMMETPAPIHFTKFDGARTIKAAITGDLPPIDFAAPDGKPDGFNIALLAEIAKRLKFNVEILSIESPARASALASGRADLVFWFEIYRGLKTQPDIPEGVIVSDPYYQFDTIYHLKLAAMEGSN